MPPRHKIRGTVRQPEEGGVKPVIGDARLEGGVRSVIGGARLEGGTRNVIGEAIKKGSENYTRCQFLPLDGRIGAI